jgi:hypothetical protein
MTGSRVEKPWAHIYGESDLGRSIVLATLRDAALAALSCNVDRWQFAIELEYLLAHGGTVTTVRQLQCEGLIAAALEVSTGNSAQRQFRQLKNLSLPPKVCLIFLAELRDRAEAALQPGSSAINATRLRIDVPHWDRRSRVLRVGDKVAKHLNRPAKSQVIILDAFEEEGWPQSIYDPLPPAAGIATKRRLHNAINRLNNGLLPVIRFHGNGDGQAICWDLLQPSVPTSPQHGRKRRK